MTKVFVEKPRATPGLLIILGAQGGIGGLENNNQCSQRGCIRVSKMMIAVDLGVSRLNLQIFHKKIC